MSAELLAWYDRHARALPWRVSPADRAAGVAPDPYRVWLSEIMLQQTTVPHAAPYFLRFTEVWPTVGDLAAAPDEEVMAAWAGLGYYARARNLLRCARAVATDHGGRFPDTEAALLDLPGLGPYTAAALAAIAFDRPAAVMDGNVERVVSRLFAVETPLPASKPELRALTARLTPSARPGDHAQAMMDLGATICTPRSPACGICPLREPCAARAAGIAETLPRKAPKAAKPTRRGAVFVAVTPSGRLLLETRPEKGLLGGMPGLPGTDWDQRGAGEEAPTAEALAQAAPLAAEWRRIGAQARHVFTHFQLVLDIMVATAAEESRPARGSFVPRARAHADRLPTVMKKALLLGLSALEADEG
ncbi:A/G-specific adenine glycosylase [Albimonas sp. CAU 1670]|uniref:A/G-specific adenine glycosylase n=1 Tax=Albimonas sp. CAU 1670 TaxID=3032599 RepID=UPI0023DCBC0E|nr:A/G-specific adenine glycosylase [Albimonas sp. CAU 1670]MDF2234925.1 A/G-specific adenine glycosylase [Albimonas sp. CAU 1670]